MSYFSCDIHGGGEGRGVNLFSEKIYTLDKVQNSKQSIISRELPKL